MKRLLVVSLVVVALACTPAGSPDPVTELGDPCREVTQLCIDDESIKVCIDDVWTEVDCAQQCADKGPAYVADGCDAVECVCVLADPDGCTPGDQSCVDAQTVEQCSPSQSWESFDCAQLCASEGLLPLGCMDASETEAGGCWCTGEGTSCAEAQAPLCADEGTAASCEGGVWVFEDCATSCGGTGQCDAGSGGCACG